ncbi:MAG: hypothetical protein M3066_08910 [Actinomycetota bacterium]|nr:hypothetical protein [Actinomycetota bacterium]
MRCPTCRASTMVGISLQLQGDRVTMHSCSHCDLRWWERNGERMALPSVLELVAAR